MSEGTHKTPTEYRLADDLAETRRQLERIKASRRKLERQLSDDHFAWDQAQIIAEQLQIRIDALTDLVREVFTLDLMLPEQGHLTPAATAWRERARELVPDIDKEKDDERETTTNHTRT